MEAERCRILLSEASLLITATRSRIERSMSLLAEVTLDDARRCAGGLRMAARVERNSSSHPPSSPPL
jgi:hypothetical protein